MLRVAGELGRTVERLPTTHEEYLKMCGDMFGELRELRDARRAAS
jgi:hypothetical protein